MTTAKKEGWWVIRDGFNKLSVVWCEKRPKSVDRWGPYESRYEATKAKGEMDGN